MPGEEVGGETKRSLGDGAGLAQRQALRGSPWGVRAGGGRWPQLCWGGADFAAASHIPLVGEGCVYVRDRGWTSVESSARVTACMRLPSGRFMTVSPPMRSGRSYSTRAVSCFARWCGVGR